MANGANGVHLQLREALEDYIKSQYFGKSPILLSAVQNKLDQEGILYQKPYIESSPAYKSELNGIQKSSKLPDWVKAYFDALANADLGVYSSPFCHQVEALEAAFAGKDLFVSTGTGSGKTECFMWPLLAKLAAEARNTPANWSMRGVRTIIMYPMNALVSDQVSRLRRLIGDSEHRFVNVFRETCGEDSRRPQFGMYTGRTPYAGKEPKRGADRSLVATYSEMLNAETDEEKAFLQKLIKDGKFPVKEDFHEFLRKLYDSNHIPDDEDAELVTRFEMQRFCPDILITNYSMLEYMLLRPIESKIWADTQNWLNADSNNKLLFVIDEAHMYRGSAGGEVSFLIRRLFHRLGIDRSRVQFILTTASMPNKNEEDRRVIQTFANDLTASDDGHEFHYLAGQQEEIGSGRAYDIPFDRFTKAHPESFEGDNAERLLALNKFWEGIIDSPAPFSTDNSAYQWLYDHLVDYVPFRELFKLCRGTTASLQELAQSIFPGAELEDAFHAVGVMLAIAPLARSGSGSVLFPARMHMLFRGIKGVYACTNPECSCAHTENGLTLGEVYFTDGNLTCKKCGSTVYELYNDRRCGSIFFRGFVLKQDFDDRKRTYLWHYPGMMNENTATQQPLYSTLPDADDVVAIKGYSNTRMAVRPNQRIIMLNKGIGDKGFTICCDCGAAMPGDDPSVLKDIMRPYRSKFLRTRCKHNETKNVNLGYDFITDMLVLEIALDRQQVSMDLAKNSWLNRAGQSLAEALRLSACQELDIEFTELVTGFRVRQNQKGDFIDIYLYDSLSSGAGYAVSIEASIQQLLIKTRELLSSCNCDSACHKCLKHYRNQYVHGLLDRSAALDLLTWAEKGVRSPMLPVYEQRNLLQSVEQILQFSGVHIDFDHEPIEAESFHGKKRIVVYPAMWARPTEKIWFL